MRRINSKEAARMSAARLRAYELTLAWLRLLRSRAGRRGLVALVGIAALVLASVVGAADEVAVPRKMPYFCR